MVRLRTGRRSVIGNGEASSPAAALESAVHAAVKQALDGDEGTADAYERVRSQCALPSPSARSATIAVCAVATQREGLLNRVAALLNPYEVTSFDYERSADGTRSRTLVGIVGSRAEVDRAAQKPRRVIGVADGVVRRADDLAT